MTSTRSVCCSHAMLPPKVAHRGVACVQVLLVGSADHTVVGRPIVPDAKVSVNVHMGGLWPRVGLTTLFDAPTQVVVSVEEHVKDEKVRVSEQAVSTAPAPHSRVSARPLRRSLCSRRSVGRATSESKATDDS